MNAIAPVAAHDRLECVLPHTLYCLKKIHPTDHAGALSGDMALIWHRHLGVSERCLLLATAAQAAEPGHRDDLAFIIDPFPFGGDDPFRQRSKQRAVDAFLELNNADRREFLAMAREVS